MWFVVGAVLIVLVAAAAWIGIRGWMAKGELEQLQGLERPLTEAVASGDLASVAPIVSDMYAHAARAAGLTSDPVWRAVEITPVVGANARAVRVASESVANVTASVDDVLDVLDADSPRTASGGVDLDTVSALVVPLDATAAAFTTARAELGDVSTDGLLPPLVSAVEQLRDAIDAAEPALVQAASGVGMLPAMLGADGERSILVMVQNTAEVRTGGGITGAFIDLHASDGVISIGATADSSMFTTPPAAIADLSGDLTDLYGDSFTQYVMNLTVTPDFALSARLASAWWQTLGEPAPDAVVAIDPVVMSALLRISGPVTLTDGTVVSADTAITDAIVTPYLTEDGDGQTRIQTDLTEHLFRALLSAPLDPAAWARELSASVSEGRVSVWSAHDDEEEVFAASSLGGTLARYAQAGPQAVGIYFNDTTTGKMDTFLTTDIGVASGVCRDDGVGEVVVSVTMTNTAGEEARSYPVLMTGWFNPSLPGDITTDVTAMAPSGWYFGGVELDGQQSPSTDVDSGANPTSMARVTLAPGESRTLSFHFLVDAGKDLATTIVHTPMLNDVAVGEPTASSCAQ